MSKPVFYNRKALEHLKPNEYPIGYWAYLGTQSPPHLICKIIDLHVPERHWTAANDEPTYSIDIKPLNGVQIRVPRLAVTALFDLENPEFNPTLLPRRARRVLIAMLRDRGDNA